MSLAYTTARSFERARRSARRRCRSFARLWRRLSRRGHALELFHLEVQLRLLARGGVLVHNAALDVLVDDGKRLRQRGERDRVVALLDRLQYPLDPRAHLAAVLLVVLVVALVDTHGGDKAD